MFETDTAEIAAVMIFSEHIYYVQRNASHTLHAKTRNKTKEEEKYNYRH